MKTDSIDRLFLDTHGRLKPCAMSYAELVTELQAATDARWLELADEALGRERRASYPRFPARTGLRGATDR
jgi:hypothetical protein